MVKGSVPDSTINSRQSYSREKPYICEYFNVFCYYPANDTNPLGGIINALIDILNKREKLPRYLVIVPEKSIIRSSNMDDGFELIAKRLISCLQRNVSRSLSARQEDLMNKKPGAVNPVPTRIIWLKMLGGPIYRNHPERNHELILSLKEEFTESWKIFWFQRHRVTCTILKSST